MSKSNPRLGDVVLVAVEPRTNGGSPEAAGRIVKVSQVEVPTDSDEETRTETRVNVKVDLDSEVNMRLTNLTLLDKKPGEDDETPEGHYAYWAGR